ncbi:ketopantoate reductase family protein [bacterium]|nr:ketopantoate reductase family protein [bacterium]
MKNVLIVGLGAIGSIYAKIFKDSARVNLEILVDDTRLARYQKEGRIINSTRYDFSYITPDKKNFKADLIIISTKNSGFDFALNNISNFIYQDTVILSLLNGIESEEKLKEKYLDANIIKSFYVGAASMREGNSITYHNIGDIVLGAENKNEEAALGKIINLFAKHNIPYKISNNINYEFWKKLMLNVGVNQVSGAYRANYGKIKNSPELLSIIKKLMKEVIKISYALGVNLKEEELESAFDVIMKQNNNAQTSMLQDVLSGNKTEVELFAGTIIKLGKKHNIKTPENEKIYKMLLG